MAAGVVLAVEEGHPINDFSFLDMFPNAVNVSVIGSDSDEPFVVEKIANFPGIRMIHLLGPSPVTLNGLEYCSELVSLTIQSYDSAEIDITAVQGLTNLRFSRESAGPGERQRTQECQNLAPV